MRRGAWAIAAFLALFSVLCLLPSAARGGLSPDQSALDGMPREVACLGMTAPSAPEPGRASFAPAPCRALPASSWPWALAAALMIGLPRERLFVERSRRPQSRRRRKIVAAHLIHAPPA